MPEVLEHPQTSPLAKPHKPWLWTREEAKVKAARSVVVRQAKAAERKRKKLLPTVEPEELNEGDIAVVRARLGKRIKTASPKQALVLAETLKKLASIPDSPTRKTPAIAPSSSCGPTTTISSVPLEPLKPSTTQVTQVVDSNIQASQANFAQYTNHLIGDQGKESLSLATRGGGVPPVGAAQAGACSALASSLHVGHSFQGLTQSQSIQAQITLEQAIEVVRRSGGRCLWGNSSTPPIQSTKPVEVISKPIVSQKKDEEVMEKVLVGGVWVWARRHK